MTSTSLCYVGQWTRVSDVWLRLEFASRRWRCPPNIIRLWYVYSGLVETADLETRRRSKPWRTVVWKCRRRCCRWRCMVWSTYRTGAENRRSTRSTLTRLRVSVVRWTATRSMSSIPATDHSLDRTQAICRPAHSASENTPYTFSVCYLPKIGRPSRDFYTYGTGA